MKSVLIVALLVSTACVVSASNDEILDKLNDLLVEASERQNQAALDLVNDAISTVNMALAQMTSAKDQSTKDLLQSHIDAVAEDLPKLEKMVNQEIKSRAFGMNTAFNFISSKASLLTNKVQSIFSAVQNSELGALLSIFKPFIDSALNDPQLKSVVGNLETVTSALEQLNKMTGGMFEPLNAVTDLFANLETTGQLFDTMGTANSSDAMAEALINTLASAKSSHANRIEKAVGYVCNGLEDAQKSS